MPKYWVKQIFTQGRFPKVGQRQKTEREKERRGGEREVITMASYALQTPPRVAHAKPPWPIFLTKNYISSSYLCQNMMTYNTQLPGYS